MRTLPLLALLTACHAPPEPEASCAEGPEVVGLMSSLRFSPQLPEQTSVGFDLDGDATGQGDGGGCGIPDDTSPDGQAGIDNAFARLLPALAVTPLGAVDSVLADMIGQGELLLMPRFRGLDDLVQDDCAVLDVVRGEGVPRLSADGTVPSHQTYDARTAVAPAEVGRVEVQDGAFEGSGFEIAFDVAYLGVEVNFAILDAHIRGTFAEDGSFEGVLAGGVDRHDVLDLAGVPGLDPSVLGIVDSLMASVADLKPGEDGTCSQISTTFLFSGGPAFLYDDPPADTGERLHMP